MRADRLILLFAAALLVAAELVSLSLLLKGLGGRHEDQNRQALEQAAALAPRIAAWIREPGKAGEESAVEPGVEPFDRLSMENMAAPEIDDVIRKKLADGELVVLTRLPGTPLNVLGAVHTNQGLKAFRLFSASAETHGFATDRILIAQHALILLTALAGFVLTALAPRGAATSEEPATRAYEEAMMRLRLRDDERFATFEKEKDALTSTLRDREAMARAGDLTAGIVHEVRNSIGAIAAHAKFGEQAEDERVRNGSLAVADEVRTIQTIMNRFVDFIRTQEVRNAPFDLGRLVERVVSRERVHPTATMEIEGNATTVEGDEDLLERAIENVVRNAAQAAGALGHVKVTFGADATHAFVIVVDDGPGIRNSTRALRPFESERPGGLGLGLPLSLKILTLHGGTLHLARRPSGTGTEAVCRWPKRPNHATNGNSPTAAALSVKS